MKLNIFKVPMPVFVSLVLSFIMLLVPVILASVWVHRVKKIGVEIKEYASDNVHEVLQSHLENNIKFGYTIIIILMVALTIAIVTFVGLIIRAGKREMQLISALIRQMESTQQAERKSMNKSQAFANANHDVRSSLAGISGLIDMCRAYGPPQSELHQNLNHMETCINDLLGIVNSILDQSKIEEGKKELEVEEFNMDELLEHVVNFYYPNAAQKNVDMILDPCDGSIGQFSRVKGDRRELRRVLGNLLHNAVKFTSEGHITVRAWARKPGQAPLPSNTRNSSIGCLLCFLSPDDHQDSDELQELNRILNNPNCVEFVFEVDDTGKGIPKENHKMIFENYVQVKDETASVHGQQAGTGLGLGIIQSLVRLMGGEIAIVEKEIGERGTCFRFNIFLIASTDQLQEHQPEDELESGLRGCASSDYYQLPASSKPGKSRVVLFIKEEERSHVIRRVMASMRLKVDIVNEYTMFSPTLKKVKRTLNKSPQSSSSERMKEVPLSSLDGTDDSDYQISPMQRRGRGVDTRTIFVLIIIDTSAGPFREISRAMAGFRKDFPSNVVLRVVWLDKPLGVDEVNLPVTDSIVPKPLHGSRLKNILRLLPECGEMTDEITPPTVTSPKPEEADNVEGSSSERPLTGKRILVVEDSKVLLMICRQMVAKLGAVTYTCGNGKEAFAQVCQELNDRTVIGTSTPSPPFDFIIMDCEMPVMDGFEATMRIREEEARYGIRIPIIALTAHSETEQTERIFQAGMDYYIAKPVSAEKLLEAVLFIESRNV